MSSPYADFPEVDVNDPTDILGYGSDTMSEICKILNGKALDNRRPYITSPWLWKGPITLQQILTAPPDIAIYPLATGQANLYLDPTSGRLVIQKFGGQIVELENIIALLQDLTNVQITSVANNDIIRYNSSLGKWTNQVLSGAGEANTASNVGTAGIGVWKQKTGVNLEFKKVNPASSKITVVDNTGVSQVDLDVAEANLTRVGTLTGMIRGNGSSAFTAVGLGSSGDVLTNVSGTPTFQAPTAGGGGGVDPSVKKSGWAYPAAAAGNITHNSLCSGMADVGTITNTWDTSEGIVAACATAATTDTQGGIISASSGLGVGRRSTVGNVVIKARCKISSTSSSRMYAGFTSATVLPISDTPLATGDSGCLVGFRSSDTNFSVIRNDGATGATATSLGVAKDTNFHTIVITYNGTTDITVTFDGTPTTVSTNMPSTSAIQFANVVGQTSNGTAKTFSYRYVYVESP